MVSAFLEIQRTVQKIVLTILDIVGAFQKIVRTLLEIVRESQKIVRVFEEIVGASLIILCASQKSVSASQKIVLDLQKIYGCTLKLCALKKNSSRVPERCARFSQNCALVPANWRAVQKIFCTLLEIVRALEETEHS
jgi:hypothetical protein